MRLDAVFLVAPRPTVPSRRAFLFVGAAFAAGTMLGAACGYSLGAAVAPSVPEDAMLTWLRGLASDATPISDLVHESKRFLNEVPRYASDVGVAHGVERLADEVLANPSVLDRRILAKWLCQLIESKSVATSVGLDGRLPELRKLAR